MVMIIQGGTACTGLPNRRYLIDPSSVSNTVNSVQVPLISEFGNHVKPERCQNLDMTCVSRDCSLHPKPYESPSATRKHYSGRTLLVLYVNVDMRLAYMPA